MDFIKKYNFVNNYQIKEIVTKPMYTDQIQSTFNPLNQNNQRPSIFFHQVKVITNSKTHIVNLTALGVDGKRQEGASIARIAFVKLDIWMRQNFWQNYISCIPDWVFGNYSFVVAHARWYYEFYSPRNIQQESDNLVGEIRV